LGKGRGKGRGGELAYLNGNSKTTYAHRRLVGQCLHLDAICTHAHTEGQPQNIMLQEPHLSDGRRYEILSSA